METTADGGSCSVAVSPGPAGRTGRPSLEGMGGMAVHLLEPVVIPTPASVTTHNPTSLITGFYDVDDAYQVQRGGGTTTWLLVYTHSGQGFVRSEAGSVVVLHPGTLVVYRPKVWHNYGTVAGDRWAFHYAHFHPRANWAELLRFDSVRGISGLASVTELKEGTRAQMVEAFHHLHLDSRREGRWRGELAMNDLERVLLLAHEATPDGLPDLDPRIERVLEIIAARPSERHCVAGLAASVNLSPSRFAHLFSAAVGRPVTQVVRDARLREAAHLLERTVLPVAEVGAAVGFESAFHFSATFRARYGQSPRGYRADPTHA